MAEKFTPQDLAEIGILRDAVTNLLIFMLSCIKVWRNCPPERTLPKKSLAAMEPYINSIVEKQKESSQLEELTVAHDVIHQVVLPLNSLQSPFRPKQWERTPQQGVATLCDDPRFMAKLCELFVEMLKIILDLGVGNSMPKDEELVQLRIDAQFIATLKQRVYWQLKTKLSRFQQDGIVKQTLKSIWCQSRPWSVLLQLFERRLTSTTTRPMATSTSLPQDLTSTPGRDVNATNIPQKRSYSKMGRTGSPRDDGTLTKKAQPSSARKE